jgi:hypothetical protein
MAEDHNPYGTTGGGDEPQGSTRTDKGITQSTTRAANDPTQEIAGTAAESAPGTGSTPKDG